MSAPSTKTLFPFRVPRPNASVRLVCLPFAGGAASVFKGWEGLLDPSIEVCAVELPGHGSRMDEPPLAAVDPVVTMIETGLAALPSLPTAYFGHSLGGRLAFACARRRPDCRLVIASGSRAIHVAPAERSKLPKAQLLAELHKLGGSPKEVLEDEDLMDMLMPIVRADFALVEAVMGRDEKVDCPLVVMTSKDDAEVPREEALAWREHTTHSFEAIEFEGGGHFFVTTRRDEVVARVGELLARAR